MNHLSNMHPVSVLVIIFILALFTVAVVLLFIVCRAYRRQAKLAQTGDTYQSRVLHDALEDFTAAYKTFGSETNTPAIINSSISFSRPRRMLSGLKMERRMVIMMEQATPNREV